VDGLKIRNFKVEWGQGLPEFFTHGIQCEHFHNVVIDGFEGRQAQVDADQSALAITEGTGLWLRNCSLRKSKSGVNCKVADGNLGFRQTGKARILYGMNETKLLERITYNPKILGGKAIIRGRRLAVEHVLGMLATGHTTESVLTDFPWLEREDIQACLLYAKRAVGNERIEPVLAETEG